MGHAEAEGGELQPAVLLLVDHQVQGWPHARQEPSLVEERSAVLGVRGHVAVGGALRGHLSQEEDGPSVGGAGQASSTLHALHVLHYGGMVGHSPFCLLLPQTTQAEIKVLLSVAMETVGHNAQLATIADEAAAEDTCMRRERERERERKMRRRKRKEK